MHCVLCVPACNVPENPQKNTWWQNYYLTPGREQTTPSCESWHCPCRRHTSPCLLSLLCVWLREKIQGVVTDTERKGILNAMNPVSYTIKLYKVTHIVYCLWHLLPQPTSYSLFFYLLILVPYSSPATHLHLPQPHLYNKLNSAGDSVQAGLFPFGHQAPTTCVSVSFSIPLWVVYNIQPPVCTQLASIIAGFLHAEDICVGWCAGFWISTP